jgi:IS30 family transposase
MRISHETIYKTLFIQARGALRKELTTCLRTGRAQRRPHMRLEQSGAGRLQNMILISDRPPEVADRAVPGHWEGDLIIGKGGRSAIGTLVERSSRYVVLLHLPHGRTAEDVRAALTRQVSKLPSELRRTLTWDQGRRWQLTYGSARTPTCRSTSVTPTAHGSEGATKTPTAYSDSTSRARMTSAFTVPLS